MLSGQTFNLKKYSPAAGVGWQENNRRPGLMELEEVETSLLIKPL